MAIERFVLDTAPAVLDDLKMRLLHARWPDEMIDSAWTYGMSVAYMRRLCDYWATAFDWPATLRSIGSFEHFRFSHGRDTVHFVHARANGENSIPLVLTHGWPGSFLEMLAIVPMLSDPVAFGADPARSFDVVVPSLPGFGFSSRPRQPGVNTFRIAELWAAMMSELGYAASAFMASQTSGVTHNS